MTSLTIYECLEMHLHKSPLLSDVVNRVLSNFKQNIFCVDDIFQIMVVADNELLRFITETFFDSLGFHCKHKFFSVFSVVWDKMALLNLNSDSSNIISYFLISYQYTNCVNSGNIKTKDVKVDNNIRLDLIRRCVDIIMDSVAPQDYYQCDDKFLFLLKTISKNLFLMGSSKYKLIDKNFPIDNMEYSLNIFIMIHHNNHQSNVNRFKLALNKVDIMRMLERLQQSLRNHNEKENSSLLESYLEMTELETNMEHFTGKGLELFWRHKMIPSSSSISFPQLMTKLNKILTCKIMTEKETLVVKKKVEQKFKAFGKRNPEKEKEIIRKEITNVNDKNKIKYKDMLAIYYETSNCDNKNNKITRFIRSAEERVIRTPFDQFAFKLSLILKSDFYSSTEMKDWRSENMQNIRDRKQQRRFDKTSNKKFCRWLSRNTNQIRNTCALDNIRGKISSALKVDVQNCNEFGFLVIRRALHVIGEFTKFTENTKNISKKFSDYMKSLHHCLSMGNAQKIRDMLSHNYSVYRIKRFDALERADYKDMQTDLQSLNYIFCSMYSSYIPNIVRQSEGALYNCKSDIETNSFLDYMYDMNEIILPNAPYSSPIMDVIDDIQKNIIPTLNAVAIEDPRHREYLSQYIKVLINKTNSASSVSERPTLHISHHWPKYIMEVSNMIKFKPFLKQLLSSNELPRRVSAYHYGNEILIIFLELSNIEDILKNVKEKDKYKFIVEKIGNIMTYILKKYTMYLKIDQMKQFLDSDKNNPALELDILRSLDAIYEELGVSTIVMQKHDEHPRAIDALMQELCTHISIYEIDKKYEALEKYFDTLGRKFYFQLKVLQIKENNYIQEFFTNKISRISLISKNIVHDSAIEMLCLETLDIMHGRFILDNLSQLDEVSPVLCGKNMRNYLAHGNISYEVITTNKHKTSLEHILCNLYVIDCMSQSPRPGRSDIVEVPNYKNDWNFDEQLNFIDAQAQLEDSVCTLNITKLRLASRRGAFFDGRNHRGQNIFEVFLNHHLQIYEQYENNKSSLSPEQLDFIEEFFSLLSPACRLNAKYPKKPRNIFREAVEAIANGLRDAVEMDILQFACASGSVETVEMIINSNLNFILNRPNKDNYVPLALACAFSRFEVISLLLTKIDIIDLDEDLCIGLGKSNDIRVFQMIIPKCRDINVTINLEYLSTLWFQAVRANCDLDIITYLIDNGANKAHRFVKGYTMIHLAVIFKRVDIVKYLITNGFDYNVENIDFNTAFEYACSEGYLEIIKIFLEFCQIDITKMDSGFIFAMHNKHNDTAIWLFEKCINVHYAINDIMVFNIMAKNHKLVEYFSEELTISSNFDKFFHFCIISNDYKNFDIIQKRAEKLQMSLTQETLDPMISRAAYYNSFEIIEKLIQMGADYTSKNRNSVGYTPLHLLALSPSYDTQAVRFILNLKDPGLNEVDNEGYTPLSYAIGLGHITTAFILLKSGADIKIRNFKGVSLLHLACLQKNIEMVELLVRYGATEQICFEDDNGHTPLDVAILGPSPTTSSRMDKLIQYLEKLCIAQYLILQCKNRRIWFHPRLTLLLSPENEEKILKNYLKCFISQFEVNKK